MSELHLWLIWWSAVVVLGIVDLLVRARRVRRRR